MFRTLVVVLSLLAAFASGCGNKDEIAGGAPAVVGATFDPVTDTIAVGMTKEQVIQAQECFDKHDPLGSLGSCMKSVLKGARDCSYGEVCVQIAPAASPTPGRDGEVQMRVLPIKAGEQFCDDHPIDVCDGVRFPMEAAKIFKGEIRVAPGGEEPSPDSPAVSDEPEVDPVPESEPTEESTPEKTDETKPEPEPGETDEGADVEQTQGLGQTR